MHVIPFTKTYGLSGFRAGFRLSTLIRREQVDIVHTFFETSDLWGGAIARLSGCRVLISSRRDMGIRTTVKHRIGYRFMNPLYSEVQAVSEGVREAALAQGGLSPDRILTVYNGLDLDEVKAAEPPCGLRSELGVDQASHLIATVAHIRRVKGIETFVRSAAILRAEFPQAVFLVIGGVLGGQGDVEYLAELKAAVESQGLDNVRFLGDRPDVLQILKLCDVFCLLSHSEGFSNALLEAMACGLPTVVTAVGGNPEIVVDERNGFLVREGDAPAAAARIATLLRDRRLAAEMGQAAQLTVKARFSTARMMEKIVGSYSRLLEDPLLAVPASLPSLRHGGGVVCSGLYVLAVTMLLHFWFRDNLPPRFSDVYLLGLLVAALVFSLRSASILLGFSMVAIAYLLPPGDSLLIGGPRDLYRFYSYSILGTSVLMTLWYFKRGRGGKFS